MKPRTVYEKAVQDFTETARRLARLDQHFRQTSFAEFKMLMTFDDEVLKRYGLPKSMVELALINNHSVCDCNRIGGCARDDSLPQHLAAASQAVSGPYPSLSWFRRQWRSNFANNLFASSCDSRRPIISSGRPHVIWPHSI